MYLTGGLADNCQRIPRFFHAPVLCCIRISAYQRFCRIQRDRNAQAGGMPADGTGLALSACKRRRHARCNIVAARACCSFLRAQATGADALWRVAVSDATPTFSKGVPGHTVILVRVLRRLLPRRYFAAAYLLLFGSLHMARETVWQTRFHSLRAYWLRVAPATPGVSRGQTVAGVATSPLSVALRRGPYFRMVYFFRLLLYWRAVNSSGLLYKRMSRHLPSSPFPTFSAKTFAGRWFSWRTVLAFCAAHSTIRGGCALCSPCYLQPRALRLGWLTGGTGTRQVDRLRLGVTADYRTVCATAFGCRTCGWTSYVSRWTSAVWR